MKQFTNFSNNTLKNKLNNAVEKKTIKEIDELLLVAKENNFDWLNFYNIKDYSFYTILDSILYRFNKDIKQQEKELRKNGVFFSPVKTFDFSLFDHLVNNGLNNNIKIDTLDEKRNIYNILFRHHFESISYGTQKEFFSQLLSRLELNKQDISFTNIFYLYRFTHFTKKDKGYYIKTYNDTLFNSILDYFCKNNIKLELTNKDFGNIISNYDDKKRIDTQNLKYILNNCSTDFLKQEDNIIHSIFILNKIKDFDYFLDFFKKHNLNYNVEMNRKYKDVPLIAYLMLSNNIDHFEKNFFERLTEHFNFQYKDTNLVDIFKEDIIMSGLYYYNDKNEIIEKMIERGVDFYSEKDGKNILDFMILNHFSKFFCQYYFDKGKWNLEYEDKNGENIYDKIIKYPEVKHNFTEDYPLNLIEKTYNKQTFPDKFIKSIIKKSDSIISKKLFYRSLPLINDNFKDEEGNNLNKISCTFPIDIEYQDNFRVKEINLDISLEEKNYKEQNILHILMNNKNNSIKLFHIEYFLENKKEFFFQEDSFSKTPLFYFDFDKEQYLKNERLFNVINKIDLSLLNTINFKGESIKDNLLRIIKLNKLDQNMFNIIIEKKIINSSLNINENLYNKQKRL